MAVMVNFQWRRRRQCFNGGNGKISTVMAAAVMFQRRQRQNFNHDGGGGNVSTAVTVNGGGGSNVSTAVTVNFQRRRRR
jgi:hypothetical protein